MKKLLALAASLGGAFCAFAAGFDGKSLTTNDWFDADFTTALTVDSEVVLNSTTGIVRGAGSWTAVPTEGTAKIVADTDAGGEATMLSVDAADEELEFTPAGLSEPTGMETVSATVKGAAGGELPTMAGDIQAAFTIYDNGTAAVPCGYTSDGWTNLVYSGEMTGLTNAWYTLSFDFANVDDVRYVRYAVVPNGGSRIVLADSEGTMWFRAASNATTVTSISFSGTGDVRSFGGDSLTVTGAAMYDGIGYDTVGEAVAAGLADGFAAGSVKLLANASWSPAKPGSVQIDTNGFALTLPASSSVFSTTVENGVYTTTYIYDATDSDIYLVADPVVENITADTDVTIPGCSDQYRYTARNGDYAVNGSKFLRSLSAIDPDNFNRGGMSSSYRSGTGVATGMATSDTLTSEFVNVLDGYYGSSSEQADSTITLNNLVANRPYKFRFFLSRPAFTASQYLKVSMGGVTSAPVYFNVGGENVGQFVTFTFVPKSTTAVVTLSSDDGQGTHTQYQAFLVTRPNFAEYTWAGTPSSSDWNVTGLNWDGSSASETLWAAPFSCFNAAIFNNGDSAVLQRDIAVGMLSVTGAVALAGARTLTASEVSIADGTTISGNTAISAGSLAANGAVSLVGGNSMSVDGTLTKTGDGDFSTDGELTFPTLSMSGLGFLTYGSFGMDSADLSFSPSGANQTSIAKDANASMRMSLPSGFTTTSLSGGATLTGSGTETVNVASGTQTFYGSFAGDMSLVKTGAGTLTLQGPSSYTGDLSVQSGTLALSGIISSLGKVYRFDASDPTTYTLAAESDTDISSLGSLSLASGYEPATLSAAGGYFGDTPVFAFNANAYGSGKAETFMMVYCVPELPASGQLVLSYNSTDYVELTSDGRWNTYCSNASPRSGYRNFAIYSNGVNSVNASIAKPAVMTLNARVSFNTNRPQRFGEQFTGVVAEGIGFSSCLSTEQRRAAEFELMNKWGLDCAEDFQPIPKTANVTVASGATLDLGGFTIKAASFSGAGTLQNGVLVTPGNIYTNTGALTLPAMANMKVVLGADATALTIVGDATNVVVEASDAFLASGRSLVVTAANLEAAHVTFNLPFRCNATPGAGTWTIATQSSGFEAATYTWTNGSGDDRWETLGNWSVGNRPVAVLPQVVDQVFFGSPTSVELAAQQSVSNVTADADVTLSGALIQTGEVFGNGKITLGDDAGFSTFSPYDSRLVISNNLEIAASETSTNVIKSLNSGSSAGSAVKVYGNITGTGMIMFEGPRLNCELAGDNSEFRGVVYVKKDNYDRNGTHVGAERAASSNAVWNVYSSGSESFTKVEGGTFKFGSLSGSVYYSNQSSYKYQTLEVGHLGLDDSLGGQWFPSTYMNLVVDSNLDDRKNNSNRGHCLRKVGAGTLTFSGKYLRKYEIDGGTLLITNNESFVWTKDESTYRSRFTFGGGTLAFGGEVTEDPSSRIAYSTAPICFTNAVGEVHTWATALASSNERGLVMVGSGTLVLKEAPLYTADTYLDNVDGTLKIPAAARVRVKTHVENKAVRRASETIDDVVYTVYTLGNKPGSMIILF